jgi:Putative helicase
MLKSLFRRSIPIIPSSRSSAVVNAVSFRTANELLLPHTAILNEIVGLAGVPRDIYRRYYQTAIHNYAIFVQQLPASESHHHSALGGMLQHGLQVSLVALKLRRAYLLPPGASPEAKYSGSE